MTAPPVAYAGDPRTRAVVVRLSDGRTRALRHYVCHSPTGFNWGYGGSGPADLALAILCDALGVPRQTSVHCFTQHRPLTPLLRRAWALHQDFKWAFIATLPPATTWTIPWAAVQAWLQDAAEGVSV
jgi:hypothetical protein